MLDEEEDWYVGNNHDEPSGWSQGEESDMEDLAELEARLYSQYHYEEDFLGEKSAMNEGRLHLDNMEANILKKYENENNFQKSGIGNLMNIYKPKENDITVTKPKTLQKRKLTQNPFYNSNSSDSDSSIDEGIIAIDGDSDIESVKSVCDKKCAQTKAAPPMIFLDRSRSESNKIAKPQVTVNKFRLRSNRDFFIEEYGSDFSENFDSDCELLSDNEEIESSGLTINVYNNVHTLSIRKDDIQALNRKSSIVPEKWNTEMNQFYCRINAKNFTITVDDIFRETRNCDETWRLDLSDVYSTNKNKRYFNKKKCPNCNHFGHAFRDCPEPRKKITCSMCGKTGHRDQRCPDSRCLGCGHPGHLIRDICNNCHFIDGINCKECGFFGHKKRYCPDLWRRYHNTTAETANICEDRSPVTIPRDTDSHKRPKEQWCCNCGRQGHLVEICRRRQYSKHPARPVTVQSYDAVNRTEMSLDQNKDGKQNITPKRKKLRKSESQSSFFRIPSTQGRKSKQKRFGTASDFEFSHNYHVSKGSSSRRKEKRNMHESLSKKKLTKYKERSRTSRHKVKRGQNKNSNDTRSKLKYTKYGNLKKVETKPKQNKHWRF